MATQEYDLKGTHVLTSKAWVDDRLGPGTFEALGQQCQVEWVSKVLPSGWYDAFALMRIMEIACKKAGVPISEAYADIAARNASQDLTTIYRAFLRLAGARGLLGATPALWRSYCKFGVVEKIQNDPGLLIVICSGVPEALLEWAAGAWNGFIPTAVELAGGSNAKLTIIDSGKDPTPGSLWLKIQVTYT